MREIKFRAQTNEGVWKYGMLTYANFNKGIERAIAVKTELGSILLERINDSTLGQFTGLYDKNGKEIYEGDILQMKDRLVQVVWHEKAACWDCNFITYIDVPDTDFSLKGLGKTSWWQMYQVIGNIYDNPNL